MAGKSTASTSNSDEVADASARSIPANGPASVNLSRNTVHPNPE